MHRNCDMEAAFTFEFRNRYVSSQPGEHACAKLNQTILVLLIQQFFFLFS